MLHFKYINNDKVTFINAFISLASLVALLDNVAENKIFPGIFTFEPILSCGRAVKAVHTRAGFSEDYFL
jgi:hypothetical protein